MSSRELRWAADGEACTPSPELRQIAALLAFAPDSMRRAETVLRLTGDGQRRALLGHLAAKPGAISSRLLRDVGGRRRDVEHRLATLQRDGLVRRCRHGVHTVEPAALTGVRGYFDLLLTAAAYSTGRGHGR